MEHTATPADDDRPLDWAAVDDALDRRDESDLLPRVPNTAQPYTARQDAIVAATARIRAHLSYSGEAPPNLDAQFLTLRQRLTREISVHWDGRGERHGVSRGRPALSWFGPAGLAVGALAVCAWVAIRATSARSATSRAFASARTFHTAAGQRASIRLADGSHVSLAPNTTLRVEEGFGRDARAVTLRGEALFDVVHEKRSPFLVRTGSVVTRVLGTTFDVAYYPTDTAVRIAVVSGKVATGGRRTPVLLTAGTLGWVTDSTMTASVVSDPAAYTTWANGRLTFNNVSVRELLATVGRWYGYAFQLDDSTLATRHVSTILRIDAQAETMTALKQLLDVSMTFRGDTVVLQRRRDAERQSGESVRRDLNKLSLTREVGR